MSCKARQYSDQKRCERCNLTWDMNDDDPPKCLTTHEIGQRCLDRLKQELKKPVN